MPQNPLDMLRDFVKTSVDKQVGIRKELENPQPIDDDIDPKAKFLNDWATRQAKVMAPAEKIADDPNYVDITPKQTPAKWYQDDTDSAFQPDPPMHVMRPPTFRTPTDVIGGPDFARTVEDLFNKVPELRGRAKQIIHGGNDDAFELLDRAHLRPEQYGASNLMGISNPQQRKVSINPMLTPGAPITGDGLETTLGHEMGHVIGVHHGKDTMGVLEKLLSDVFYPKK